MKTEVKQLTSTKIVIGPFRLSYAYLTQKFDKGVGEPKFMTNVLIPKSDTRTIAAINEAIKAAIEEGISKKWGGKKPRKLDTPLRDGDEKEPASPDYEGMLYINPKSSKRPPIVDKNKVPLVDDDEIYSGMWANVIISFWPYAASGNNGIGVGLEAVQKVKDDDRLGGGVGSVEAFDVFDNSEEADY